MIKTESATLSGDPCLTCVDKFRSCEEPHSIGLCWINSKSEIVTARTSLTKWKCFVYLETSKHLAKLCLSKWADDRKYELKILCKYIRLFGTKVYFWR